MRDIFISHVEENSDIAIEIAEGLEAAGYSTWYYERDSVPGPSYLLQTAGEIERSSAVVLIISPHSLSSHQVTKEVIRAHESGKPFVPVLCDISHVEFGSRQPEWREAVGSSTSISIPSGGIAAIVPRILNGVRGLGIQPSLAAQSDGHQPETTTSVAHSPTPPTAVVIRRPGRPSLWPKLALAAVAVAMIGGVAAGVSLLSGDEPQKTASDQATNDVAQDLPDAEESVLLEPDTTLEEPADSEIDLPSAATTPLKTSIGKLRVSEARLTTEVCPPPDVPEECQVSTGAQRYLVLRLEPARGGSTAMPTTFVTEALNSSVSAEGSQAGSLGVSPDIPAGQIRIVYGLLPAKSAKGQVLLFWPKNKPLELNVKS